MRLLLIPMLLLLTGCTLRSGQEQYVGVEPAVVPQDTYSKEQIDAINLRIMCRQRARTMVEIARCDTR